MAPKKKQTKKAAPKKAKTAMVVMQSPADPSLKVAVASEFADDALIESEMMGEVLQHYVYEFDQNEGEGENRKKKTVTGLSTKGVNEVVRRLNRNPKSGSKIRISPLYKTQEEKEYDGEKGIEVSVFAEDLVTGNTAWGIKFEPYKKKGRNGTYKNTFAVEKALAKAERNAKRKLIPEVLATKMIKKLMAENPDNVKRLEAPPGYSYEQVQQPQHEASSPEQMKHLIRRSVETSKTEDRVLEFDRKVQASKDFDDAFKKEIRELCAKRLDTLKK